jgi:hypothetical protein
MANDDLRPDIAAAREQMRATVGSGKEVKHLATHLWEGERVERMAQGQRSNDATAGLLVQTDKRLLYLKQAMFGSKTELPKVPTMRLSLRGGGAGAARAAARGARAESRPISPPPHSLPMGDIKHGGIRVCR